MTQRRSDDATTTQRRRSDDAATTQRRRSDDDDYSTTLYSTVQYTFDEDYDDSLRRRRLIEEVPKNLEILIRRSGDVETT